jgi:hypothetical protein
LIGVAKNSTTEMGAIQEQILKNSERQRNIELLFTALLDAVRAVMAPGMR